MQSILWSLINAVSLDDYGIYNGKCSDLAGRKAMQLDASTVSALTSALWEQDYDLTEDKHHNSACCWESQPKIIMIFQELEWCWGCSFLFFPNVITHKV